MKRMDIAKTFAVSLTLPLVLSACGGSGGESVEEAQDSPSPEHERKIPQDDLSGFALYHDDRSDPFLTFHDVSNGKQKIQISLSNMVLSETGGGFTKDSWKFSPDFRYVAVLGDGAVHLGELDDENFAYVESAVIEPEQKSSFSGGEIKFRAPKFSPDGEELLMLEDVTGTEDPMKVLSVSTSKAAEDKPDERGTVPKVTTDSDGKEWKMESSYSIDEEGELQVWERTSGPEGGAWEFNFGGYYDTDHGIVPRRAKKSASGTYYAMVRSDNEEASEGLYSFDLSQDGKMVNKKLIAEEDGNGVSKEYRISDFWIDDKENRIIIESDDSYYQTPMDSQGEPELLFPEFQFEGPDAENLGPYDKNLGFF
ncbi:hypothetical protein [Nocardiopsis rhodophaea]|uniref:hypothetical protein n=1 Tax=Nocardiopsis rhodophaea TaxID=280238 RepID=UPI0031CF3DC2